MIEIYQRMSYYLLVTHTSDNKCTLVLQHKFKATSSNFKKYGLVNMLKGTDKYNHKRKISIFLRFKI